MRIIEIGLPETFPDDLVPQQAACFVSEIDGMDLSDAKRLANERGYMPSVKKLTHLLGDNEIWGFAITVDGLGIPFMVKVEPTTLH